MQYKSRTGSDYLRYVLVMYNEHTMSAESLIPLKSYKRLSSARGRFELGAFLVEGKRAVYHILESFPETVVELLLSEGSQSPAINCQIRFLTDRQFHSISQMETPQKIMAVVRLPQEAYADTLPNEPGQKVLLLEDIQDPGNVGTLIRTAVAFGFDGIIMSQKSADPFSPKCIQATAGCVLSLWIRRSNAYIELSQTLQRDGLSLVVADISGDTAPSLLKNKKKLVLALGNEARGLSKQFLELADTRIQIPIDREKAESLNVAVSGAILMYLSSV